MLKEFKEFALRGNAVDMAVGIIIGAAFSKIVSSLVNDVLMPPIGMLLGKIDFSNLAFTLQEKSLEHKAVAIKYGLFINNVLDFIIVSFVIFLVIRQMNRLTKAPKVEVTTKDCPWCFSKIAIKAMRCPNCTSEMRT